MTGMPGKRPDLPWLDELRRLVPERLRAQKATREGLANHLGVTHQHVSQILNGHTDGSVDVLTRMAAAVGLSVTVQDSGQPPAPLPGRRPRGEGKRRTGGARTVQKTASGGAR